MSAHLKLLISAMRRRYFFLCIVGIVLVAVSSITFSSWRTMQFGGVRKFGPLVLGGKSPTGAGDGTFAPYLTVPQLKFYVTIVQDDLWCINESCGIEGALVYTMGGWLEMETPKNFPDIEEMVGLNLEKNENIHSIVTIGDREEKLVGIYPNKGLKDLVSILHLHPDVVDFNLLKGVNEFGPLKIGELAPRKPGDPTGYTKNKPSAYPLASIPAGKKFYMYVFNKDLIGKGYCAFYECETRKEYPNGSYIEDLGGWFSSDGLPETARAFGLDPVKIARGEESLVVVTDPLGKIIAIHPHKTLKDILAILSQLSDVADVETLYQR